MASVHPRTTVLANPFFLRGKPERAAQHKTSPKSNWANISYSTIVRAFKVLGAKTASLDLGAMGKVALW